MSRQLPMELKADLNRLSRTSRNEAFCDTPYCVDVFESARRSLIRLSWPVRLCIRKESWSSRMVGLLGGHLDKSQTPFIPMGPGTTSFGFSFSQTSLSLITFPLIYPGNVIMVFLWSWTPTHSH
ncbi:hypothetical protein BJX68DRAFT_227664 [Aspergillus pseudodeflectus]|uniref:Uncharacterized protein n=1 Tax=Aspergillus pseudodeflectus TaxID=176178 RepID=A0ABR4L389_9EURO